MAKGPCARLLRLVCGAHELFLGSNLLQDTDTLNFLLARSRPAGIYMLKRQGIDKGNW